MFSFTAIELKSCFFYFDAHRKKSFLLKALQFVSHFYPTDTCPAILNAIYWRVTGQWLVRISSGVHCELVQVVHIKGPYFTLRMIASGSKLHLLQAACLRGEAAVKFVGDK